MWPPNSPDLNPDDYSVWGIVQQKVYKRRVTDFDDLKHRIRTEWAKLGHAVIASAMYQRHAAVSHRPSKLATVIVSTVWFWHYGVRKTKKYG